MKVQVVKDKHGKTLATFETKSGEAKLEPTLQEGHKLEEMEVPEHYVKNLSVVYKSATR